jgi:hypothetical protein
VIDRQPKEFDMLRGLFKQKKTDNVIEVLLGKEPGTLDINNHEVSHNGLKQVIIWQLAKKLQSGNFTGFEWVDPTDITSTFDTPEISADGNSLTIGDHNGSTAKKGDLAYIITVELDGTTHTSRNSQPEALMRDPVIINR